jgi:hypothetical protein
MYQKEPKPFRFLASNAKSGMRITGKFSADNQEIVDTIEGHLMSKMSISLLGEKQAKRQIKATMGGALRPGIKVPTKEAAAIPEIAKIYNQGVSDLKGFDEIEKEILKKFPTMKNCLIPRNVEYFSVTAKNFPSTAAAKKFVETFGEDRGDGVKRIYTVPVAFKSDELEEIFPNTLQGWANDTYYCMVIDEQTGKHMCMHRKPIESDKAQRRKVLPRELTIRSECSPNTCDVYGAGKCKFNGTLEFYVPGTTVGLVSMTTTSAYAAEDIWASLVQAKEALGNLPALNPNTNKPVFWLRKVESSRAYYEKGERKTTKQWSPKLFSELDYAAGVASRQLNGIAQSGAPALDAPVVDEDGVIHSSEAVDSEAQNGAKSLPHDGGAARSPKELYNESITQSGVDPVVLNDFLLAVYGDDWESSSNADQVYALIPKAIAALGDQADSFMRIRILSKQHKIIPAEFDAYAKTKFGNEWKGVSKAVLADLQDILRGGEDVAIAIIQSVVPSTQNA